MELVWIITETDGSAPGESFIDDPVFGTPEDARQAFIDFIRKEQQSRGLPVEEINVSLDEIPTEPGPGFSREIWSGWLVVTCHRVQLGVRETQLHERHAEIEAEMIELEARQRVLREESVQIEEELEHL